MLYNSISKIADVVTELFKNPHKTDGTLCAVRSDSMIGMSPRAKSTQSNDTASELMDEPYFSDDVKTLQDIPPPFLWAALQKKSKVPTSTGTIAKWMQKNPKVFRQAFTYLTGTPILII